MWRDLVELDVRAAAIQAGRSRRPRSVIGVRLEQAFQPHHLPIEVGMRDSEDDPSVAVEERLVEIARGGRAIVTSEESWIMS